MNLSEYAKDAVKRAGLDEIVEIRIVDKNRTVIPLWKKKIALTSDTSVKRSGNKYIIYINRGLDERKKSKIYHEIGDILAELFYGLDDLRKNLEIHNYTGRNSPKNSIIFKSLLEYSMLHDVEKLSMYQDEIIIYGSLDFEITQHDIMSDHALFKRGFREELTDYKKVKVFEIIPAPRGIKWAFNIPIFAYACFHPDETEEKNLKTIFMIEMDRKRMHDIEEALEILHSIEFPPKFQDFVEKDMNFFEWHLRKILNSI